MRKGLVGLTLNRRVSVLMMAMATALVGLIAYFMVPLELAPEGLVQQSVSVYIPVPASNPVEIQEQVIRPAEEQIRTIPGITKLRSRARADSARLGVSFARDVDIDLALAELRDRMERARPMWPADVRNYFIWRFSLDNAPVISFAIDLQKGYSDQVAFLVEEKVIKALEAQPGVARVQCWGLLADQVRVHIDREKAESMGVSIYELTQTLSASNVEVSGGEVEDGTTRLTVRTDARFKDLEELRNFPVNADGLLLREIATVEPGKAVRDFVALARNKRSLWCNVSKESSANTVAVTQTVRKFLNEQVSTDARLSELGATVRFYDRADMGLLITSSLETLRQTAMTGAVLALFVLVWFLRRLAPTFIITASIPLSLLMTMGYIYFSGGSLNILSMLGITISIGMLIDNSIVVVENIARFKELGEPPLRAARLGASEVALAITLSTLTTVAAFLPIIFMSGDGMMSFFTGAIGLPLCAAVLSSLVVALVFIPLATVVFSSKKAATSAATARPANPQEASSESPNLTPRRNWRESWVLNRLRDFYAYQLRFALRNRMLVVLAVIGVVAPLTYSAYETLPKVDLQSDQGGSLEVDVDFGKNFSLNDAYVEMDFYGKWLDKHADEYGIEHFWCFFSKRGGEFDLDLVTEDMVETKKLAKVLKEVMPTRPGVKLGFSVDDGQEEDRGKLSLEVHGPDPTRLMGIANSIIELTADIPGVLSVNCDLEEGEEEVHVRPDREQAARYGIDPRALRGTIEYGIRGWRFSDLVMGEREIPLIIEYDGAADRDLPQLRELAIPSEQGARIPLSSVADISVSRGFGEIRRVNGRATAKITYETADETPDVLVPKVRERLAELSLPEGYTYQEARLDELKEAQAEMKRALLLSVVFVFLLMGILFESFMLPFSIIVAVPFSWAGAVWALAITSTPIDFVGMISVIVLVGIVVNNGIVLVDCAHRLVGEGRERSWALVQAGRTRFRPILMTAVTTVVGLIPMAITDGSSQISYKALSRALIGGLLVSTFFTLFFVPILYSLFDDLRRLTGRLFTAVLSIIPIAPQVPKAVPTTLPPPTPVPSEYPIPAEHPGPVS